jgi:hypothetical protein
MRAFFADGVDKVQLQRAVHALPVLIHLYMALFVAGLAIFLFNINHGVFVSVIWWIGLSLIVYGWVTVMPIFWLYSLCYTPLSRLVWSLHAFLLHVLYRVLAFIVSGRLGSISIFEYFYDLSMDYRHLMSGGVLRAAEETAQFARDIDLGILMWTMDTVSEGYLSEEFFQAVPGFLNSDMVRIPEINTGPRLSSVLHWQDALNGFLRRTLSTLVPERQKNRHLEFYLNTMNSIFEPDQVSRALSDILRGEFGELPQSIETAESLARWYAGNNRCIALATQCGVASILQVVPQRDDRWIALASDRLGLDIPRHVLQDNIAHGDNSVSLAISIHMTRQVFRSPDPPDPDILLSLSKFDIRNTAPGLQHEFCALWNEIVREARDTHTFSYVGVLRSIRQLYIGLHQGTDAAPTFFDASTDPRDPILDRPSSYPSCNIDSHHPASTVPPPTQPIPGDSAAPQEAADDTPHRPHHPQGFPSTSSTTDSVHVSP